MARYIDADMLLKELDLRETDTTIQLKQGDEKHRLCQKGILSGLNWSRNIIYNTPTADVEEVKLGKWIKLKNKFYSSAIGKSGNIVKCSICEEQSPCGLGTPYCSICGAKMDVRRNTQ